MLNSIDLNDKTYPELLAEAIAQIPLYSSEWTNFNVSDPGITLLQNLTAFQLVQQETINEVPEEIRKKLLELVGYTASDNRAATLLVQAPPEGGGILPAGHLLWSGTIPFETTEQIALQPWGLAAVYGEGAENWRDLTRLLSGGGTAYPFGRTPVAGDSFVCVLSGIPEMGEPIRLWLQVKQEELRTPFEDEGEIPNFSRLHWQYYTAAGWQNVRFEDETMGLLRSGAVTLWLEGDEPAVFDCTPVQGCALRCSLDAADYDRAPRLQTLVAHLFPVKQQYTGTQCLTVPGAEQAELFGRLPQVGNLLVLCREEENGPYHAYQRTGQSGREGRFYREEETPWGMSLYFDSTQFPCACTDGIRVICYDNEMVHHRLLDTVRGYDNQVVRIGLTERVLEDSFLLLLEVPRPDGDLEYHFVAPGEIGPDGFKYHLRSQEGELVIDEPGLGGCRMFIAHCAVTEGERGNLRAGSELEQRGGYDGTEVEARYACPAPGRGGVSYESDEEVRARFSADLRRTEVAVRTEDYEVLVRRVPGLCIHKVKAVAVENKNLVKVAVKPYTEEKFPTLSQDYLRQINTYLEPRRMLTTRFEVSQPRYVPVGVQVSLNIRGMEAYARGQVEELLRTALDYVNGPQNFGTWVRFNQLYQKLVALPFVESVDSLNLFPESQGAQLVGSDVRLEDDSLCYPGTIQLTLREQGR